MKNMSTSELREQLASLVAVGGRWAFRGEDKIYLTTVPTIARIRPRFASSPDVDVHSSAGLHHRASDASNSRQIPSASIRALGSYGYPDAPVGRGSLVFTSSALWSGLTHYLDVSLNSEVALWFALRQNDRRTPAVVCAVDLDRLPPTVREVNHAALKSSPYDLLKLPCDSRGRNACSDRLARA